MSRTVPELLGERLGAALAKLGLEESSAPDVTATADARFGDYQSNAAMVAAKRERRNPRELAAAIAEAVDVSGISDPVTVAGPGFLNFRLTDHFIVERMGGLAGDSRCGVVEAEERKTVIIDFSSPNVAKPMHVGHIRSTILGDALARIFRFMGHHVITDNHIGDWGTQFGKVIYGWKNLLDERALEHHPVAELVRLYRDVNKLEGEDPAVATEVRSELVKLQAGDPENRAIWERVVALSWQEFERLYGMLDIRFDERLGESFYNDRLAPLVERLERDGIARESEGALCIFFDDVPELADKPCIVRKSDGGFLYATTDLATLEYRIERWNPTQILYITGAPQALHFKQVFAAGLRMGVTAQAEHVPFGSILGEDRKIMKTRSGENVQLGDVLDEAVERARKLVAEKNPDMPEAEAADVATTLGIGAVKYAELSQNRMTDYIFSWEKMLSFQGNTAPYLQNAYVRIRSIFRKLDQKFDPVTASIQATEPTERVLAVKLIQFSEAVPAALTDYRPNLLANYLYELAIAFHGFYEACPVLRSEEDERASRLALCDLTARTLGTGLDLLGIRVPERM